MSLQDVYATNLHQNLGYPLRTPEPTSAVRELYQEGLRIGDVGYVDADGSFTDLFNVCFPLPASLCNAGVPPHDPIRLQMMPYTRRVTLAADYLFMTGVERHLGQDESRVAYKFAAKSNAGAILILPSDTTFSGIRHKPDLEAFREVAAKHALAWCQFAGRDSLYLITSVYKTSSWTLGSFYKGHVGGEIHVEHSNGRQAYKWKSAFETDWQGGPRDNSFENQTVIIKGFKMTIRWSTIRRCPLPVIEWMAQSESQHVRKVAAYIAALLVAMNALFVLSQTTVEHCPRLSEPLHPLDIVNRYLLEKNTAAHVAITHDNEWIDMLEEGRLKQGELMETASLRDALETKYSWYSYDDTVYLQRQNEDPNKTHHNVITHIRAENVTVGLERIPVRFYVQLDFHDGTSRRTTTKPVTVYEPVVEWDDVIQLPSDPSVTVGLTVYASFESVPMLGKGEPLHELTISVGELLNGTDSITFPRSEEDIQSPQCSLLIRVQQWYYDHHPRALGQVDSNLDWEHSSELAIVTDLGHNFLRRYHRDHRRADLESSVTHFKRSLDICGSGHPCRAVALFNFATVMFVTYQADGTSLDFATSHYQQALQLRHGSHPDRAATLLQLSQALLHHYGVTGYAVSPEGELQKCINELIRACREDSHECRAGNLLLQTYERLRLKDSDDLAELDNLISMLEDATQEPPEAYFDRPIRFNNLGLALLRRSQLRRDPGELDRAIKWLGDATRITSNSRLDKPGYLSDLSEALLARFQQLKDTNDLDQATEGFDDAARLTPDGHRAKPIYINNLGLSFFTRFYRLGGLSNLERAIASFTEAADLTPHGHPCKPTYLNNLGHSFKARFQCLGKPSLHEATVRHKDTVDLAPHSYPSKPNYPSNLGSSLTGRFQDLGEPNDLEQAIAMYKDAVDLTPYGHPNKPKYLSNLGNSLTVRFKRCGELNDLEQAISRFRDAAYFTPDDHPYKPSHLNNLGNSFLIRFQRLGEISDLEQAISRLTKAINLTPSGHPCRPSYLSILGNSFKARFEHLHELSDLQQAILLYSHAACATTGSATSRFHASQHWISCARILQHSSLLHAYSVAIGLLPQLAWIGLSLRHRYRELMRGADVVREAAAVALDSGFPETAVEWLEQGRSIVWRELFQLRNSYEELSSVHPEHARRLRELSIALEQAATARKNSWTQAVENWATESLEQEANRHRKLANYRDQLLRGIRRFSGFERFLLHKEFSRLRASAHSGPVVILNAAQSRCDALIVLADVEHAIHVPLPNFTFGQSTSLVTSLKTMVRHTRLFSLEGKRAGKHVQAWHDEDQWEFILSSLWKCVVKPVLDTLALVDAGKGSRIFWCPTGPFTFLPIHAAGFYDSQHSQPGHKLSDFVVSSYTPTLSILTQPLELDAARSSNLRFLAVRQPPSDGLRPLPGAHAELRHTKAVIRGSPSARTTHLESSIGTVEEVLTLMKKADWVHFACHGIQDTANPTNSGLCLANERRLRLSDIISLPRPRGGLAFLSTCQTAVDDTKPTDEAINIATGMLFAGYCGAIGTMWSINDSLAPDVAKDVYERLFSNGRKPDYREAARALHDAVGRLRDSGAPFSEWLPFIHVGL